MICLSKPHPVKHGVSAKGVLPHRVRSTEHLLILVIHPPHLAATLRLQLIGRYNAELPVAHSPSYFHLSNSTLLSYSVSPNRFKPVPIRRSYLFSLGAIPLKMAARLLDTLRQSSLVDCDTMDCQGMSLPCPSTRDTNVHAQGKLHISNANHSRQDSWSIC